MNQEEKRNMMVWNDLTKAHLTGSKVYPIKQFKKGKNVLREVEINEIGSVKNKKLLHLQCHFGMDTLSWARLGAKVTGVDFSEEAINAAKRLSIELGIQSNFITSDIYDLSKNLKGKFDIVFASYGALYWIGDIDKWMKIAANYLKKNGMLYVVDGHPFRSWLEWDDKQEDNIKLTHSYFDRKARKFEPSPDYANQEYTQKLAEYGWHHTVGDLINSAISAGLRIEHFNEFKSFELRKSKNGLKPIGGSKYHPVMFSLKATKT